MFAYRVNHTMVDLVTFEHIPRREGVEGLVGEKKIELPLRCDRVANPDPLPLPIEAPNLFPFEGEEPFKKGAKGGKAPLFESQQV